MSSINFNNFRSKSPLIAMPKKQQRNLENGQQLEDKKMLFNQQKAIKNIQNHQDENIYSQKIINFRKLKDTNPNKLQIKRKDQPKIVRPNQDNKPKSNKQLINNPSHEISINVNIQNMMPKVADSHENSTKINRALINAQETDKRKPKTALIKTMKRTQDLQCIEQINFKMPTQKKMKISQKLCDRGVIDKKNVRQIYSKTRNHATQPKQLIKKLQQEANTINMVHQAESMQHLDHRQQYYQVPAHYIEKYQKNYTWMMRVILIQWMNHVCYQFSIKRQTFHIAVNLIDLYMCKQHHLQKSQFQLVGAAAMFIASKLEQFEPKCSEDFAKTTKGRYTAKQIKQMQLRICKTLKYRLNPPTLYMWANRFMLQWDNYVQARQNSNQRHPLFVSCQPCFFKKSDQYSIRLFWELMQYVDCAALHIHTVQYKPKLLVCSFMYLLLGSELSVFKKSYILNECPNRSQYLLDIDNPFNDFFMSFLEQSLGINLIDLLPTIQYAASFFLLILAYDDPILPDNENKQNLDFTQNQINLEQYCSFQTHNPNMTMAIKNRSKNLR